LRGWPVTSHFVTSTWAIDSLQYGRGPGTINSRLVTLRLGQLMSSKMSHIRILRVFGLMLTSLIVITKGKLLVF
jgi:hypothetical protein